MEKKIKNNTFARRKPTSDIADLWWRGQEGSLGTIKLYTSGNDESSNMTKGENILEREKYITTFIYYA